MTNRSNSPLAERFDHLQCKFYKNCPYYLSVQCDRVSKQEVCRMFRTYRFAELQGQEEAKRVQREMERVHMRETQRERDET